MTYALLSKSKRFDVDEKDFIWFILKNIYFEFENKQITKLCNVL